MKCPDLIRTGTHGGHALVVTFVNNPEAERRGPLLTTHFFEPTATGVSKMKLDLASESCLDSVPAPVHESWACLLSMVMINWLVTDTKILRSNISCPTTTCHIVYYCTLGYLAYWGVIGSDL